MKWIVGRGEAAIEGKSTKRHQTEAVEASEQSFLFKRTLDRDQYYVRINRGPDCTLNSEMADSHVIDLSSLTGSLSFCVSFGKEHISQICSCQKVFDNSRAYWLKFWEEGGFVKFESTFDPRAEESSFILISDGGQQLRLHAAVDSRTGAACR